MLIVKLRLYLVANVRIKSFVKFKFSKIFKKLMPYRDRCISSKKKLMIETSYIYDSLDYVLSIMSQCFIPINTTYIKSFMKSQKKLKKLPWVGTREIFFVNFRYQKQGRVYRKFRKMNFLNIFLKI